jgi:putative endonuclease
MERILKNHYRQVVGKWGETAAADYLMRQGCLVKEVNVRTSEGEIDLIVELEGELRFVEVKTRTSNRFGNPEEAITRRKFDHMRRAAESYLAEKTDEAGSWHLDVIAIQGKPGSQNLEFEWFKDVEIE